MDRLELIANHFLKITPIPAIMPITIFFRFTPTVLLMLFLSGYYVLSV